MRFTSPPRPFLISLPMAELHLHLEGSIEPPTLVELRQRHGMEGASLPEVEKLYNYADFAGFLAAFKDVTGHLQTPEDYELITYRVMESLKSQNVLHAEVFVSVGVCLWRKQDFAAIFEGLERGRERGEKGFGIGGDELQGPAELFKDVYARAGEHGLHLTAHAGENAGPESIWGALNLKAERIGHGLTAGQDPELIEELAERQIPIEICVISNVRTGCCADLAQHPVRRFFDQGLMLILHTDDPAMFRTSLVEEYRLVQDTFGFSDEHLREMARNSFEASFLPAEKKVQFLDLLDATALRR